MAQNCFSPSLWLFSPTASRLKAKAGNVWWWKEKDPSNKCGEKKERNKFQVAHLKFRLTGKSNFNKKMNQREQKYKKKKKKKKKPGSDALEFNVLSVATWLWKSAPVLWWITAVPSARVSKIPSIKAAVVPGCCVHSPQKRAWLSTLAG